MNRNILLSACIVVSISIGALTSPLTAQVRVTQVRPVAGIVNGDTVWLDDYSRAVAERARELGPTSDRTASDIVEETWQQLVQRRLLQQAATAKGIATSDHDAMVSQLQQKVTASVTVDTTALYAAYLERYHTANVDVIHLPCTALSAVVPGDDVLEKYYEKKAASYTSARPLRRLAILTWPFIASPVDSTLMLGNITEFVTLVSGAASTRERDSIWNAVAETVPSGSGVLHPDSASQAEFYLAVDQASKGKKKGVAVGPIVHRSGTHVFLVDSIAKSTPAKGAGRGNAKAIYYVRIVVPDIEPSRETVDSMMSEVNTAQQMYRDGRPLVDIATTFNRTIELSPYFGADNKLYESYRLVDAAFTAPVGAMLDPVDSPERGAILGVVVDSVPAGPLPFDAARDQAMRDWQREQACEDRRTDMMRVHAVVTVLEDGRMILGAPLSGVIVARDVAVNGTGAIGDVAVDRTAANALRNATDGGLMGPFRGDAGWYLANVHYVVQARPEGYLDARPALLDTLATEQKRAAWEAFLRNLLDTATITDRRATYFRY